MAATPFIDLNTLDLDKLIATREEIYQQLPHRYEFMQLDGLIHFDMDNNIAVGLRKISQDEFWVKGHIPSRPIFPGVLMIESAAQLASYLSFEILKHNRFMGFGGVDAVKFRGAVTPPATMYIILKLVDVRSKRIITDAQGIVDGKLVFEARITGMPV